MNRVALYARVSPHNEQDPEMQLWEMREYSQRRAWEIASEYVEAGVLGSQDSRPELNRLMIDAQHRQLHAVLVWKLDRFGRPLKHLVNALAEFEALGIAFVPKITPLRGEGRSMANIARYLGVSIGTVFKSASV